MDKAVFAVFETTNYDQFQFVMGNRTITEGHVMDLVNSLKKHRGLVPIVVNENFEVIDGQNRLEACRRLNLPVYYVIEQGAGTEEIMLYNKANKNWETKDYLNYYKSTGSTSAAYVLNLMNKYNIGTDVTITAIGKDKHLFDFRRNYRNGSYPVDWYDPELVKKEDYLLACDRLNKAFEIVRSLKKSGIVNRNYILLSVIKLSKIEGFEYERLIRQSEKYSGEFFFNYSDYERNLLELLKLYNHKKRSKFADAIVKKKNITVLFNQDETKYKR